MYTLYNNNNQSLNPYEWGRQHDHSIYYLWRLPYSTSSTPLYLVLAYSMLKPCMKCTVKPQTSFSNQNHVGKIVWSLCFKIVATILNLRNFILIAIILILSITSLFLSSSHDTRIFCSPSLSSFLISVPFKLIVVIWNSGSIKSIVNQITTNLIIFVCILKFYKKAFTNGKKKKLEKCTTF